MDTVKTIAMLIGLGLMWNGYNKVDVTPVNPDIPSPINPVDPLDVVTIKVIVTPDRQFPGAPTDQDIAVASAPIQKVLSVPSSRDDAFRIADTFRAYQKIILTDRSIQTTQQFQAAYKASTALLLQSLPLNQDYKGQLDTAMDATFRAAGIKNEGPWTDSMRTAAANAMGAISYQAFQGFTDAVLKSN